MVLGRLRSRTTPPSSSGRKADFKSANLTCAAAEPRKLTRAALATTSATMMELVDKLADEKMKFEGTAATATNTEVDFF